jgi:DNA-binding SARP family transcriptional activator
MLRIKLFGTGQAQFCEHPLVDFSSQQPCFLLCYLLLNKHYPHHREQLAANFWSECSTSAARKRLRNVIWLLRKSFQSIGAPIDKYLVITEDTVFFINSSEYWLDTEIFEKMIQQCQDLSGRTLSTEQVEELEAAVELYIGDLLENIYEDWVLYDRERYRISYLNALSKLMVYHGINGNYERGLAYGECILSRDCTREKIHRRMMWLHSLSGNRDAALTQYQYCCQILQDELGIRPMEETQQIYHQLQNNQFNPRTWVSEQDVPLPLEGKSNSKLHPLAKHALQKLHQLQKVADETSAELRLIEQLISEAFINPDK